ncbi:MAG: hypothetical protein CME33_19660 [Gimesia sp.]|nr:hypothetical protein [Gimesia sp.]
MISDRDLVSSERQEDGFTVVWKDLDIAVVAKPTFDQGSPNVGGECLGILHSEAITRTLEPKELG